MQLWLALHLLKSERSLPGKVVKVGEVLFRAQLLHMSNIEHQSDVKKAHASGVAGADAEVAAAKHVAEEAKMQQKAGILWRHSLSTG